MKNMSLNVKLWTLCGSLLALLLLVGGVGYRSAAKMESLVKVVQATTQKQGLAASIELAIEKEKVGRREIVLHNDLQYLKNAREEFQQQVDALRPLLTTPTSHRILDQIEAANANYCQSMDEEIQLHQAGKDAQVMELLYGSASQEVREDLKKATGELLNWFGNQAADAEAEELDFVTAASTLEAEKATPRDAIGEDYYAMLAGNKKAFHFSTDEELVEPVTQGSRSNSQQVLKILKSFRKDLRALTDDQEAYLSTVIARLESGSIPKQTAKNTMDALQFVLSGQPTLLKVLGVLQKAIPSELLESYASETGRHASSPREIILSEYFRGPRNG